MIHLGGDTIGGGSGGASQNGQQAERVSNHPTKQDSGQSQFHPRQITWP